MKRRIFPFGFLGVLLLGYSLAAMAGEKEDAKQLFQSGLALMKQEQFARAATHFERSLALYPTQNGFFNLANCYKALRRNADSLEILLQLRRTYPDTLNHEITEKADQLERELRTLVAWLTVETVPADTAILVDGRLKGKGSRLGPIPLDPGDHEIEATHSGHQSMVRRVRLIPAVEKFEKIVLLANLKDLKPHVEPAKATVLVEEKEAGPAPFSLKVGPQDSPPNESEASSRLRHIIAWSALTGTVVTGGAALMFWQGFAKSTNNEKFYNRLAIGCGIGAGVLAVTAVSFFIVENQAQGKIPKDAHLAVAPGGFQIRF